MGAIITGIDIPKECINCPLKNSDDNCLVQSWKLYDNWETWDDMKVTCPIKSINGLIKEIKNIDLDKSTNDFYGMQKKIIKVIKEYCEVTE